MFFLLLFSTSVSVNAQIVQKDTANMGFVIRDNDTIFKDTIQLEEIIIFKGKIDKLMNILDPTSKVMKMRVILNNPDYILKPQMFATVTVNNSSNIDAIAVSSNALIFDHSQYYVLIYKDRKDIQIRPVEVISINGNTAFLKSGVATGELLIGSQAILIYGSLNS